MKHFNLVILLFFLLSLSYINLQAADETFSAPPSPPQGEMSRPHGARCMIIPAGFHHGSYETTHLKCRKHHSVFITGYFTCSKHNFRHGRCRHWKWVPGHWVRF